jgi:hypothetical protein
MARLREEPSERDEAQARALIERSEGLLSHAAAALEAAQTG